jgi:hypothetical protein
LPRLALNYNPPDLRPLSSWDYRHRESPVPGLLKLFKASYKQYGKRLPKKRESEEGRYERVIDRVDMINIHV